MTLFNGNEASAPDDDRHPAGPLPILQTIALALRVFARAPGRFLGLVTLPILLGLIPSLFAASAKSEPWYPAARAGAFVIEYALEFIAHGAIITGVAAIAAGTLFDFETSLGIGLRRSIAYLGVTILQTLAVFVATLLFIIPGIVVALMLFVSIPATVLEGLGPIGSLRRSAGLTSGSRWRILAMGVVIFVPAIGVVAASILLVKAELAIAAIPLMIAAIVFMAILGSTLPTVLFLQLRAIDAGAEPLRLPGDAG